MAIIIIIMYLIRPFDVSKLGSEIVTLLVKGSNTVTTDGALEGIGGASATEQKGSTRVNYESAKQLVLTNYSNLNRL